MNVINIRNYKIIQIFNWHHVWKWSMTVLCYMYLLVQLSDARKSSLFKQCEYDLRMFYQLVFVLSLSNPRLLWLNDFKLYLTAVLLCFYLSLCWKQSSITLKSMSLIIHLEEWMNSELTCFVFFDNNGWRSEYVVCI